MAHHDHDHDHAHNHNVEAKDNFDPFDSILNLESNLIDEGYEEGVADGDREGVTQGRVIGFLKGREIGRELGFISACASLVLSRVQVEPDRYPARLVKSAQSVKELIEAFHFDAKRDSFGEDLDRIRGKWRLLSSQTDLKELFQSTPRSEFSF